MTWANQIKILKQQFEALGAVIGGGLINALKPFVQAMNAALSGIIDFAEKVVNALGKIFGWVIEITPSDMAIDDAMIDVLDDQTSGLEDVADAADDAAKSIEKAKEEEEEYQRTVLGFDELNKLNAEKEKKEDEPGASNKGNSAVGNPLKNLDLSKASAGAGDVKMSVKKIKSLYESEIDTLYDLGKYISDTLTKALNGIQWDKVYAGASNFGKGLASFLNGLITPDLFGELGRTIANSLNTALQFLNSFGKEFDFKNFGNALKAGLDALLANFNWNLAKDTARTWAKGMADGLNEFINPETFAALGRTIAEGINTALDFLDEFSRDFDFKNLGDSIENGLIALLGTIDWKTAYSAADGFGTGLADFLNELITPNLFDEVGKTVASVMNTALHFLDSFGKTFKWDQFGTSLATGVNTFLDTFDWKLLGTSINTWVNGVFDAIESFLATIQWETLFDGVKTTLSKISFASIGANIIDTLWAGINGSRMGVIDKKKILESFSELETTLRTISGFIFTNLDNFYTNFLVPVGNWVLGDGLTEFTRIINDVLSGIDWEALNSGLSGMYSVAKDFTIGVGKGILTFLDGLQKAWNILIAPFINLVADALGKLFDAIDGVNGSVVESIGKGVGVLLGAVVAYKIGTSITTGIAKLGTSLGTLIPAIVAHPALAIAACGAAIGVAIYDIVNGSKELKSQTAKNIDATASAIDALSTTLSNTDISVEADYKYIKEILDKYMTLNSELLTKGSLSEGDQSMFAFYHDELASYAPDIVQYIGEVGTAYQGTREELEKLLEKQHEQALFESYVQVWKDANTELQNQRVNIEKIRLDMAQGLLPVLQEVKDKTGIDVDLNYSSEDFQSLLDFLHDGTFNSDLLTDAMKNLVDEGFGGAYLATLDLMKVENTQGDTVKDLWKKYDDGQISLSNAEYMLGLVEDMINNLGIDTGNLSTTTDTVMSSIEKRYGDAKEVISDKTNGMYTDAKARFDDINRTIEEHGTTGVEKIKQFPWSSPMGEVLDDMGTVVDQKTDTLGKALEKFGDDAVGYLGGNGLNGTGRGVTSRRIQSLNAGWDLTITKGIKDPVQAALEIKGAVSGFFDKIGDSTIGGYLKGVADKVPEVKSEFESLPGKLKDKMGNVFNFFKPAGEDTIGGLSQGEKDTRDDFLGLYPVLIDDARDKFKDVKHVFELQGQLITIGLKGGVNSKRDDLLTAISTLESDMKGKFTQFIFDGWSNIGSNLMNSMNSGIISVTETLKSTISSVQGAMYNQINNQAVYDGWWRVGHDLMQTLVNGINSVRPHIPVPHFDVITGYSGTTPYPIVRNLGWYAKGGLAYDASVIGVGEAGNEAVIPLENPGVMQAIAEAIVTAMPDAVTRGMVAANVGNDRPIVVNATLRTENNEVLARAVAQGQRQIDYRHNAVARY